MPSTPEPIDAHGLIGDCRSVALVARDGTIDWLCWPRFDSAPIFAALLDPDRGGGFRVAPVGMFRSSQRYVWETNVLETTFEGDTGAAVLVDLMPVTSDSAPSITCTDDGPRGAGLSRACAGRPGCRAPSRGVA